MNLSALYKIGYGLYVVTTNDGKRDNGCIVNAVIQVTNSTPRVAVTVNKTNYTHDVIKATGKLNLNCLTVDAPFYIFQTFGFSSGRDNDKFANMMPERSANGLAFLPYFINSYISLEVEQYVELDTHGMFICKVTDAEVINSDESMTYAYYHANVKPKPQTKPAEEQKKGYVCKICGHVYEGETLPEDYICPICKHPACDFEPLQ